MRSPRAVLTAMVLAILGLLAVVAPSASAITGGEPDGNRHPNVGLILFYDADGRFRCSATLISPTVLDHGGALHRRHARQDAGHLRLGDRRAAAVSPFPVAADPSAGYTRQEITAAGYLSGTAYTHPDYSNFTDLANWNDVGVIVLDEPVTGITPATLAPENYLDAFAQPRLNKHDLRGRRLRHRGAQAGVRPAEAAADELPADPALHDLARARS